MYSTALASCSSLKRVMKPKLLLGAPPPPPWSSPLHLCVCSCVLLHATWFVGLASAAGLLAALRSFHLLAGVILHLAMVGSGISLSVGVLGFLVTFILSADLTVLNQCPTGPMASVY